MEFLLKVLMQEKPSEFIRNNSEEIFKILPELAICKDFKQNNIWHNYDVFEHIIRVVDGVPNNLILRMAALFHDIGKPFVYKEDKMGVGHFFGHWDKSKEIFCEFAQKYSIDENIKRTVSNLILYHDLNIDKLSDNELAELIKNFDTNSIVMLFQLKRSDLLAQSEEFHYLLENYKKQEIKVLSKLKENSFPNLN